MNDEAVYRTTPATPGLLMIVFLKKENVDTYLTLGNWRRSSSMFCLLSSMTILMLVKTAGTKEGFATH